MKEKIKLAVPNLWSALNKISINTPYYKLLTEYKFPEYGDVVEEVINPKTDYEVLFKTAVTVDSFIKSKLYNLRRNIRSIETEFTEQDGIPYLKLLVVYD